MDRVNLTEQFAQFEDIFSLRIVEVINDMHVKSESRVWHLNEKAVCIPCYEKQQNFVKEHAL